MKIFLCVGTRPNFVKVAPLIREFKKHPSVSIKVVHSGQHYDPDMAAVFLDCFDTDMLTLDIKSCLVAEQIGKIMIEFADLCSKEQPDLIIVFGDVNSTLAYALVANTLPCKLAHVEAGMRCFNKSVPEEINRILVDNMSDYLFVTSYEDRANLISENLAEYIEATRSNISVVGDIAIDQLIYSLPAISERYAKPYAVLTLHRQENVDNRDNLESILIAVAEISETIDIVFPVHPRTRKQIDLFGLGRILEKKNANLQGPLGYLEFTSLIRDASFVMTDSGGIQVETAYLEVPSLILRNETERPQLLVDNARGWNTLVGSREESIVSGAKELLKGFSKPTSTDPLWDGKVAERIVKVLLEDKSNES